MAFSWRVFEPQNRGHSQIPGRYRTQVGVTIFQQNGPQLGSQVDLCIPGSSSLGAERMMFGVSNTPSLTIETAPFGMDVCKCYVSNITFRTFK